jgi:hypothetical protein
MEGSRVSVNTGCTTEQVKFSARIKQASRKADRVCPTSRRRAGFKIKMLNDEYRMFRHSQKSRRRLVRLPPERIP